MSCWQIVPSGGSVEHLDLRDDGCVDAGGRAVLIRRVPVADHRQEADRCHADPRRQAAHSWQRPFPDDGRRRAHGVSERLARLRRHSRRRADRFDAPARARSASRTSRSCPRGTGGLRHDVGRPARQRQLRAAPPPVHSLARRPRRAGRRSPGAQRVRVRPHPRSRCDPAWAAPAVRRVARPGLRQAALSTGGATLGVEGDATQRDPVCGEQAEGAEVADRGEIPVPRVSGEIEIASMEASASEPLAP